MPKPKRSAKRTRRPVAAAKKKPVVKKKAAAPNKAAAKVRNVDGYVQLLPPQLQPLVQRLRALVAAASPEAIEAFQWGQPVYEANGPFAYIKAYKSYVNFGFWRGAVIEAPRGLLEGDGTRMRHLKLASVTDLDDSLIKSLIQQAVLLNSRLGNPTQRSSRAAPRTGPK